MNKIPFEDGTLVKEASVTIDGVEHQVKPAEYTGDTPLSAYNLKKMQDNIEDATMIKQVKIQGNSVQEGTPSIDSEAPIESVGDNINLFDIEDFVSKNSEYYTLLDEILTCTKTDSRSSGFDYIPYKKGTYIISTQNSCRIRIFEEGNSTPIAQTNDETKIEFSIETDKNICFKFFATETPIEIGKVKIEKGSIATPYSTYGQGSIGITMGNGTTSETKILYTQQPFRSIGEVRDRFVKQNGVWYEKHNVERKILTGAESWYLTNTANGFPSFNDTSSTITPNSIIALSNMLKYNADIWNITEEDDVVKIRSALDGITIMIKGISTVDNFKTKLTELYNAGTPLYVDYVLATPTLIECTAEQVEVLNAIYTAYADGMTNTYSTDTIEAVIEIESETKEKVQADNNEAISALIARVSQLEELVATLQSTVVEEG